MIGYVTLGSSDLDCAARFYDPLMAELGVGRWMAEAGRFVAWGAKDGATGLGLTKPHDGKPPSVGNGVMVALEARDRAQVDRLYTIAMAHGGTDEGAPGERHPGFYAAYFRDPDGNKLNAYIYEGGPG